MSYIGRGLDKISNIEKLDTITFDGSSSYTLQKNSVNFTPNSANSLQVSIDGVVQAGNFTVSGSTIDFGVAIPATSTNDLIFHYGTGVAFTPADGTVGLAQLSATGTKDATTFLRGDNTFAEAGGGKLLQAVTSTSVTNITTTSTSFVTTNFDLTITPASTSNKILLMLSSTGKIPANEICLDIYRSTSSSFVSGGLDRGLCALESANAKFSMPIINLDSPNTTSAITYTIYFKTTNSGQTASFLRDDLLSSFTAMEISA